MGNCTTHTHTHRDMHGQSENLGLATVHRTSARQWPDDCVSWQLFIWSSLSCDFYDFTVSASWLVHLYQCQGDWSFRRSPSPNTPLTDTTSAKSCWHIPGHIGALEIVNFEKGIDHVTLSNRELNCITQNQAWTFLVIVISKGGLKLAPAQPSLLLVWHRL